ncbi:hypothetical protein OC834_006343 [Tilletia horrida]|nr:hypothetical protein OC834_006343 [Tilletia horrida]
MSLDIPLAGELRLPSQTHPGIVYKISHLQHHGCSYYTCSCPAFYWARGHVFKKTCKHITNAIGAERDQARLQQDFGPFLPIERATFGLPCPVPDGQKMTVAGWLVSEKLDGIRAMWDGSNLHTRSGNTILAPSFFTDQLPADVCLDGELWISREREDSHAVNGLARRAHENLEQRRMWEEVVFFVFDAPTLPGDLVQRLESLGTFAPTIQQCSPSSIDAQMQCVYAVPQRRCDNFADALSALAEVHSLGGEGPNVDLAKGICSWTEGNANPSRDALKAVTGFLVF